MTPTDAKLLIHFVNHIEELASDRISAKEFEYGSFKISVHMPMIVLTLYHSKGRELWYFEIVEEIGKLSLASQVNVYYSDWHLRSPIKRVGNKMIREILKEQHEEVMKKEYSKSTTRIF